MRICRAGSHIPCAIRRDMATMSNLFRSPLRRRLAPDVFLWGLDLFNRGYYWEAHGALQWPRQVVDRGGPSRMLFWAIDPAVGTGVKDPRGASSCGCGAHAGRAAALLRRLMKVFPGARLRARARHVARGGR